MMKISKKKKNEYYYLLLPLLAIMVVAVGFFIRYQREQERLRLEEEARQAALQVTHVTTEVTTESTTRATTEEKKKQDVIDFGPLKERNEDVYAWIKVPGTEVDYPVLQHPDDVAFYLHHNIDKEEDIYGAIYTEHHNDLEFEDPNTIVYGHNMNNGSMFASLHRFEDADFFHKHRKIIIYTEEEIHHYEIFAAFVHSNEHVLYGYDFYDPFDFDRFLSDIYAHKEDGANIDRDLEVTSDDNLITLSTCNHGRSEERYLVVGVQID